jgi:alpha-ketoglutarate-dependent taurine dioxygenase
MIRRRIVSTAKDDLVKRSFFGPDGGPPLVVQPAIDGVNWASWLSKNRESIESRLYEHGAILFRNFNLRDVGAFERFVKTFGHELLSYSYQSTPRSKVSGSIYTSTEYPAAQTIAMHNEMSYASSWPMKIFFYCVTPAAQGGETPIADSRRVFVRIDPRIRERFIRKQIMYVRNYDEGLDLSWTTVFQTTDRSQVEAYCHEACIEFEWLGRDRLRTRQVCQAAVVHPITGAWVWFNQAHLFHISSLEPSVQAALSSTYEASEYPRNAYYGDGSVIEDEVLESVREAYRQETTIFSWQAGDVLMLDNMLMAHGRQPFMGQRKVVVAMVQAFE